MESMRKSNSLRDRINPERLKVVEIFSSIDGEGIRTGIPCVFIRLHGCNCQCSYCDSNYACEGNDYVELTIEEILNDVEKFNIPQITLTGGEPLIHSHVYELIDELVDNDYEVNIETNGSVPLDHIQDRRQEDWVYRDHTIVTMDWKCKTSGMTDEMLESNLKLLKPQDALKFVVGSKEDLDQMKEVVTSFYKSTLVSPNIFVSPVFGKIEPSTIVAYILENNLHYVRTQVQLHKIIWDPDMRGV